MEFQPSAYRGEIDQDATLRQIVFGNQKDLKEVDLKLVEGRIKGAVEKIEAFLRDKDKPFEDKIDNVASLYQILLSYSGHTERINTLVAALLQTRPEESQIKAFEPEAIASEDLINDFEVTLSNYKNGKSSVDEAAHGIVLSHVASGNIQMAKNALTKALNRTFPSGEGKPKDYDQLHVKIQQGLKEYKSIAEDLDTAGGSRPSHLDVSDEDEKEEESIVLVLGQPTPGSHEEIDLKALREEFTSGAQTPPREEDAVPQIDLKETIEPLSGIYSPSVRAEVFSGLFRLPSELADTVRAIIANKSTLTPEYLKSLSDEISEKHADAFFRSLALGFEMPPEELLDKEGNPNDEGVSQFLEKEALKHGKPPAEFEGEVKELGLQDKIKEITEYPPIMRGQIYASLFKKMPPQLKENLMEMISDLRTITNTRFNDKIVPLIDDVIEDEHVVMDKDTVHKVVLQTIALTLGLEPAELVTRNEDSLTDFIGEHSEIETAKLESLIESLPSKSSPSEKAQAYACDFEFPENLRKKLTEVINDPSAITTSTMEELDPLIEAIIKGDEIVMHVPQVALEVYRTLALALGLPPGELINMGPSDLTSWLLRNVE